MSDQKYTNALIHETSPYLLQHAHNPVDWYPWGERHLQRARQEDKPILLSIGYSACHWCHVMEHESFENEDIARIMNENFINIKVDREERPDLDEIYMNAVQMMTGSGGWPMTVFLTPEQVPFYGGTYFPPEDRHGMPGFPRVLLSVAEAYRERKSEIERDAGDNSQRTAEARAACRVRYRVEHRICSMRRRRICSPSYDSQNGGFGRAPKFPPVDDSEFLLRSLPAFRRPKIPGRRGTDPGQDGRRRDLRPTRRRFSSLFGRSVLAGSALRKDALRQCPACAAYTSTPTWSRATISTGESRKKHSTTSCGK